jgi:hypothetical protein
MRWEHVSFVLGILLCLIGAFSMAFGEGLLGENHAGIATVIGIVGIGLLSTSSGGLLKPKKSSVYSHRETSRRIFVPSSEHGLILCDIHDTHCAGYTIYVISV